MKSQLPRAGTEETSKLMLRLEQAERALQENAGGQVDAVLDSSGKIFLLQEAREALQKSEMRYRRLFESARDGILILDAGTGMVVDVNPFLIATLGFSYEHFLTKTVWELGFFKDVVASAEKFAELREQGYVRYENLPLQTCDGQRLEVEFISNVYLVEGRKVIQCNVRDVTARKRAEEEVRLRENALDEVSQGVMICDENRRVVYANTAFTSITGYQESELLGESCSILQGPGTSQAVILKIRRALNALEPFEGEILNYRKNGESFWNELTVAPIHGEAGRPVRFIGIQRDVTQRKHTEEMLRVSEQRFAGAFEHAPIGVALALPDGRWIKVNRALCELVGYSESELLRRAVKDITHPDDLAQSLKNTALLLAGEISSIHEEKRYLHARGYPVSVELNVSLVRDAQGQPLYFIAQMLDITERKQAEATLRESKHRYQSLFENMVEGYAYCSLLFDEGRATDFVYLEVNAAFTSLTGLKNVTGKKISEVVPSLLDEDACLLELYARVARTGQPERSEVFAKSLGIWFSLSVYCPEKDHFVAIFDNITERKETELKIRFDKQRYQSLIEATSAIVWDTAASGRFEVEQPRWSAFTGQSFEELRGAGWLNAIHPEDRAHTDQVWTKALTDHTVYEVEHRLRAADGSYHDMQVRAVPILGEKGEIIQWLGVHTDITPRKEAEQALLSKTALFEAQVDCALDGILVVDGAGRKILQNHRMTELWKIPAAIADCPDDSIQLRFVAERTTNPAQFAEQVAHLSSHPEEVSRDEIELVDGTFLDRYSAPVQDKAGNYYGRIWTFRDVTEGKNREQRLSEALAREKGLLHEAQAGNLAKNEFLAVMSHEIRTPLNGILGFSEMLAGASGLSAECRDYVRTISSSGEALLRILDDILVFSRLEAGGMKLEKSLFCSRDVLQDIHALLGPQASDACLDFEMEVEPGVANHLWNDAGRLRQVLLNLVGNAIKFTERGSITLGVRNAVGSVVPGPPDVEFYVRDTGRGISPDKLEDIFAPFTQADSSISRRYGGTGLGLSISRNLVSLMGGRLTVRSKEQAGSEFCVTLSGRLPECAVSAPLAAEGETLGDAFASRHPLRVLLVEDDKVNLKLLRMMLRKLGYSPIIAHDGIEAVELFRIKRPDCVLMDLQMPRKDGLQATREIREIEGEKPSAQRCFISALTANVVDEDHRRCLAVGMDTYMNKPVRRAALAAMLIQASEKLGAAKKY